MSHWIALAVVTAVGLVVGLGVRARLGTRSYRYADESGPQRSLAWVPSASAGASAAVGWGLREWPVLVQLTALVAAWMMIALAAIDLDVHRLPRQLTWPSYPALAILLGGCSVTVGGWAAYGRAVGCGFAAWSLYYLLHRLARRRGLGRGDVTLAGLIGMLLGWFSWPAVVVATYAAFLLGGVGALALLLAGRVTRQSNIAFGPAMLAGAFVVLVLQ